MIWWTVHHKHSQSPLFFGCDESAIHFVHKLWIVGRALQSTISNGCCAGDRGFFFHFAYTRLFIYFCVNRRLYGSFHEYEYSTVLQIAIMMSDAKSFSSKFPAHYCLSSSFSPGMEIYRVRQCILGACSCDVLARIV